MQPTWHRELIELVIGWRTIEADETWRRRDLGDSPGMRMARERMRTLMDLQFYLWNNVPLEGEGVDAYLQRLDAAATGWDSWNTGEREPLIRESQMLAFRDSARRLAAHT